MRVLFTFAGGRGHLDPLLGVAAAAVAAGHDVAFCGRPWMVGAVERLGFRCFPSGSDAGLAPTRVPLVRPDVAREQRAFRGFAGRIARERLPGLLAAAGEWQPDLIVAEQTDFGAVIAAERLGLPYATVEITAPGIIVPDIVADASDAVRAEAGLPPDPQLAMLGRGLVLTPFPPSYRERELAVVATARAFRVAGAPSGAPGSDVPVAPRAEGPAWLSEIEPHSAVYFTLGTVFPFESGDLFTRVLAGLRELPAPVIVTVGPDLDPAELGPQPENVHVAPFLPHDAVMARSRLVASHAGSGTVLQALSHGVPMLSLPIGADQPLNAARCEALGIARTLDVVDLTPEEVLDAAAALLADGGATLRAAALRDEIAALPGPEDAVAWLEGFAAGGSLG